MSWSRRSACRLLAIAPAAGLAACGFRPLYGSKGAQDSTVAADLASIRVDPLNERVGQQLHNFLRDRLNPHGQPVSPSYRLRIALVESKTELGVQRDETASRANLRLDADFALLDAAGEQQLFQGRSSSTTSYDILRNPFATTVSETDARERALREVADDIQTRLALYFKS